MTPLSYSIAIATCAVLIISVFTDVRHGKIYNAVTVPFAILGIILNILDRGWTGVLFSLGGIATGLAMFFVSAFLGRILGAGDCKLLAAVGSFLGAKLLIWVILYGAVAGGLIALAIALWRGVLRQSVSAVWRAVYMRFFMKLPMDITTAHEKTRLPYAIAICAGGLMVMWQFMLGS
ncbi:MAG: prepilin peptidase [Armatimonadetes bacterium]|nr:prepilin peptidase [Armatimonadota bacterium]